jgi:hypothetical protein
MLASIATLNDFAEQSGITEVAALSFLKKAETYSEALAQSYELLRDRWRKCCRNTIYFVTKGRSSITGMYPPIMVQGRVSTGNSGSRLAQRLANMGMGDTIRC